LPLYEYQCDDCGRFEVIQKFSDAPLSACPKCGNGVQKLLSAPAIQFKGTGWYVTDYARKASPDSSKSDSPKSEPSKAASDSTPTKTTSKESSATGSSPAK
jgi:putative FmdB family regulatory protein